MAFPLLSGSHLTGGSCPIAVVQLFQCFVMGWQCSSGYFRSNSGALRNVDMKRACWNVPSHELRVWVHVEDACCNHGKGGCCAAMASSATVASKDPPCGVNSGHSSCSSPDWTTVQQWPNPRSGSRARGRGAQEGNTLRVQTQSKGLAVQATMDA